MAWRGSVAGTRLREAPPGRRWPWRALVPLLALVAASCGGARELQEGAWRAWLDSPGGDLPFGLEIRRDDGALAASVINGEEVIPVPEVRLEGGELHLGFPHYASAIRARVTGSGKTMHGEWTRRSGPGKITRMAFHARHGPQPRFAAGGTGTEHPPVAVGGRWRVEFAGEEGASVGLFRVSGDRTVQGTFLTPTGDYRYLAGALQGRRLLLSCFDGAHAFLFRARARDDGSLAGDFWSRDTWHDTWTAVPDDSAAPADGFALTEWRGEAGLEEVFFPDLDGVPRSLGDPAFAGRARIIEVFGTWCPNCNDAAPFLSELHRELGPRGLSIVGIAFEMTGDFRTDAGQVRIYRDRHGVGYPLLLGGTSPKDESSRSLPVLDRVRAYPTFIFLDAEGRAEAVYSGFSGPATGEAHRALRRRFREIIEGLLEESPGADTPGKEKARTG